MAENFEELPQECWESIFNSLDDERHFEFLSSVSKQFLSTTNYLRRSLKATDLTEPNLPRLFCRFQNLKRIDFREFHGDLDDALYLISRSCLDLESLDISNQKSFPRSGLKELGLKMKNLKELNCAHVSSLHDEDVIAIAKCCLSLEDLDISYPEYDFVPRRFLSLEFPSGFVTDSGILALSDKLKKLKKIDISGNIFVSDKSLISMSLNFVMLREIVIRDCDFMTQNGIGMALRNRQNLVSISLKGIGIPSTDTWFEESFRFVKGLCEIQLSHSFISDEFLCLLAESCLPLKKIALPNCYNFTSFGIFCLLSKYQSLEYLNLAAANFLEDKSIIEFSKFLCNLKSIELSFCSKLTNSTFFSLIRGCPLLTEIKMEATNLGIEEFSTNTVVNPRITSLHLARNINLSDEFMNNIALLCPSLEILDTSYCPRVTENGIAEILKTCHEIRQLEIKRCGRVRSLGINCKVHKLEILRAQGSGINDDGLEIIGETCSGLLHLDLESCLDVTSTGLMEVVIKCTRLRGINLRSCEKVDGDSILAWMVFSRPSLRKIIPPCCFAPTDGQRKLFLSHGCLVYES